MNTGIKARFFNWSIFWAGKKILSSLLMLYLFDYFFLSLSLSLLLLPFTVNHTEKFYNYFGCKCICYRKTYIGTKSMQRNISIQKPRSSGNPEVSQTPLTISTILIAFRKAIHLDLLSFQLCTDQ